MSQQKGAIIGGQATSRTSTHVHACMPGTHALTGSVSFSWLPFGCVKLGSGGFMSQLGFADLIAHGVNELLRAACLRQATRIRHRY